MRKAIVQGMNNLNTRHVLAILIVVAILSAIFSALRHPGGLTDEWWSGFAQNFSTEMFGAIATFVLIELIIGKRQDKKRLIIQMRSRDHATALNAVDELRGHGWLSDGSLQGENFVGANLQGAYLVGANLQGASFWFANLRETVMENANFQEAMLSSVSLQDAYLTHANLKGATLSGANMEKIKSSEANFQNATLNNVKLGGANLRSADLRGADLRVADLRGADLTKANLQGTNLLDAGFDETTTLPDRTLWTPETDITRFTDPNHSDDSDSPANRGDSS